MTVIGVVTIYPPKRYFTTCQKTRTILLRLSGRRSKSKKWSRYGTDFLKKLG